LDASDFDFDSEVFESLCFLRKLFSSSSTLNWDRVLHPARVLQIQPLDLDLRPFRVYAQPAADGKAREQHAKLSTDLTLIGRRERITIGAFGTDGNSGYDPLHENPSYLPTQQKYKVPTQQAALSPNAGHHHSPQARDAVCRRTRLWSRELASIPYN
jgi:hypothetical protein